MKSLPDKIGKSLAFTLSVITHSEKSGEYNFIGKVFSKKFGKKSIS